MLRPGLHYNFPRRQDVLTDILNIIVLQMCRKVFLVFEIKST